jgi:hypothetical protein
MQTATSWQDLLHPGDATDFFSRRLFSPFDANANGYSPNNALWLAELSRLVYRHDIEEDTPPPQPTRNSYLVNAGFKQRQFFLSRKKNTQAMLVEYGGTLPFAVLVFRGTEQTIENFITSLQTGISQFKKMEIGVHKGFQEAINSVWCEIDAALAQLICPVFYTGHSLGAALATLAAARRAPKAVYTFGSPRVGNQAFISSLGDVPFYRIVDDEDIVATIPPEVMDFRHVGAEHRLIAPKSGLSSQHLFDPPKPLADHAPINYVDRV